MNNSFFTKLWTVEKFEVQIFLTWLTYFLFLTQVKSGSAQTFCGLAIAAPAPRYTSKYKLLAFIWLKQSAQPLYSMNCVLSKVCESQNLATVDVLYSRTKFGSYCLLCGTVNSASMCTCSVPVCRFYLLLIFWSQLTACLSVKCILAVHYC